MAKVIFTDSFEKTLSDIEDYILLSTSNIDLVSRFTEGTVFFSSQQIEVTIQPFIFCT